MLKPGSFYLRGFSVAGPLPMDAYFAHLPAVAAIRERGALSFEQPITFLVGENGSGKSTLIEALAVALGFNAEGGTRNFRFSTAPSVSALHQHIRLIRSAKKPSDGFFLRAESFFNAATYLDELNREDARALAAYGDVSLHGQSHGEAFLALVEHRFSGKGLYLLDEPEAALSPMRLMALICRIHDLVRADSQFLIATHSPLLMAMPNAQVLEISQQGIAPVHYRQTEHFQVMKAFLDAPERMMGRLLDDEE